MPHHKLYSHLGDINQYRSLLCLNGELPSADFFKVDLPIVAVDGALNSLANMGIMPSLVIGDMDGANPQLLAQVPCIYTPDQNKSDFQKAMAHLAENNLLPTIVLGVGGGYLDHILNNINHLTTYKSIFYAPPIVGHVLNNEERKFQLPIHSKLSLIAMPRAVVSTTGLKWELSKQVLQFPGENSCFNRTIAPEVHIKVKGEGTLIILLYLESIEDAALSI